MKISRVVSYQILDSRGRPTVAANMYLEDGSSHIARIPSGASTGAHEALELRDKGTMYAEKFYGGSSVLSAVAHINEQIAPRIVGTEVSMTSVDALLNEIDPSPNHGAIGANAKLAISLATAKAEAHSKGLSLARLFAGDTPLLLPMPMVNILSGGAHANRTLDIQDILVIPHGAKKFSEALSWVAAIRERAAIRGREMGLITHLVADEGGLGIPFPSIAHACNFVVECIEKVGLNSGGDVSLAIDFASTQYFHQGEYRLESEGRTLRSDKYLDYVRSLVADLPILSVEDPCAEDDWGSWQKFSSIAPQGLQILGDDLFTTNLARLERGITAKSANAILIKVNQNGLVSGTKDVLNRAKSAQMSTVVSARSGETEDSWLADLAVGWSAGQIKVGSTHGSERNAKWNRLLELEATEKTLFASFPARV
jgi:enolase